MGMQQPADIMLKESNFEERVDAPPQQERPDSDPEATEETVMIDPKPKETDQHER